MKMLKILFFVISVSIEFLVLFARCIRIQLREKHKRISVGV
jgi:hypothetical protein